MIWFRTKDHFASPFSNGSTTEAWNVDIETEWGQKVRIHIGPHTREDILEMLKPEAQISTDAESNCN